MEENESEKRKETGRTRERERKNGRVAKKSGCVVRDGPFQRF